jgi:hypothetical protein
MKQYKNFIGIFILRHKPGAVLQKIKYIRMWSHMLHTSQYIRSNPSVCDALFWWRPKVPDEMTGKIPPVQQNTMKIHVFL